MEVVVWTGLTVLSRITLGLLKKLLRLDCNYVMASLDVESLFTNIPLEETIENCVNELFFHKSKIDNLT